MSADVEINSELIVVVWKAPNWCGCQQFADTLLLLTVSGDLCKQSETVLRLTWVEKILP